MSFIIVLLVVAGLLFIVLRVGKTKTIGAAEADKMLQDLRRREARPLEPSLRRIAAPLFEIEYVNRHGEISEREIEVREVRRDGDITYIEAYCHLYDDDFTFRADRVLWARDLQTNREVDDIATHLDRYY